jgi:PIN domain nuclease of toxin-antitoxin system
LSQAALLDTHTFFWLDTEPERLTQRALALIRNRSTHVHVSPITAWELSIKHALGKMPKAGPLLEHYHETLARYGFSELPFTSVHALLAGRLEGKHKDPFDRALVAQAVSEQMLLITNDEAFQRFADVRVFW